MLSYVEHDNAQAVEIHIGGKVSTEEFNRVADKLEAFIARHGQVRVLEQISDFEGMDAAALWHDVQPFAAKDGKTVEKDRALIVTLVDVEDIPPGPLTVSVTLYVALSS